MSKRALCLFAGLFLVSLILVYRLSYTAGTRVGQSDEPHTLARFHEIFYGKRAQTWLANRWLGIQTSQNPNDAWVIQEIIVEQKPDFVVETGTKNGGSALIWAMVLREVNPQGRVITVDIEDKTAQARSLPLFQERVDFLLGSSTDPQILATIKARVTGKRVVVLLDSDHRKPHVLNELRAYSSMVNVGSYLIAQDGILSGHPIREAMEGGPWEAIDEFLSGNKEFQIDRGRERLLFTYCPRGYLKRVK